MNEGRTRTMTTENNPSTTLVRVDPTTTVLADRFRTRLADRLAEQEQDAWWQRTDYAWVCSHHGCKDRAGVNYKSRRGTYRRHSTREHAPQLRHRGGTVSPVPDNIGVTTTTTALTGYLGSPIQGDQNAAA